MPKRTTGVVPDKRVGIVELARALDLSTYSVSRALNGHKDVSAATRERVIAAAEHMHYTPNALGRTLRRGRTDTICLMLTPSPGHFIDSYFLPIIAGLDGVLSAAGYSILVAGAAPDAREADLLRRIVEGRRADAVVMTRVRVDDPRARTLREGGFPFAMLGRDQAEPETPFVDADHREMAAFATRWLIERGHRRIALVNAPASVYFSVQIHLGWMQELTAAAITPLADWLREGDYTTESGREITRALVDLDRPPTAIVFANDFMAFGATEIAASRGLTVGRDLSIIGCDDVPLAAFARPQLSTFRTSRADFGDILGKQVLDLLNGRNPASHLIVPEFIDRGSAGLVPSKRRRPARSYPA